LALHYFLTGLYLCTNPAEDCLALKIPGPTLPHYLTYIPLKICKKIFSETVSKLEINSFGSSIVRLEFSHNVVGWFYLIVKEPNYKWRCFFQRLKRTNG
jgi:hypothetical protein